MDIRLRPSYICAVSALTFIRPSEPVEQSSPPLDEVGWYHEVQFDGDRLQLHKRGKRTIIFAKTGKDATARFGDLAAAVAALPCSSCVIDCKAVPPDSPAQIGRQKHTRVAFCFDLMELDSRDMRPLPLLFRRVKLSELVEAASSPVLRFSEAFPDPQHLLAAARERGLRGIVSKLGLQFYVSGSNEGWISVSCRAWRGTKPGQRRIV